MEVTLPDWKLVTGAALVGAAIAVMTDIDSYFETKRLDPFAVYSPRLAILRAIRGAIAGALLVVPTGLSTVALPRP